MFLFQQDFFYIETNTSSTTINNTKNICNPDAYSLLLRKHTEQKDTNLKL